MAKTIAVFVLPSLRANGAERVLVNLLSGLDQSKLRLHLAVFSTEGTLADRLPTHVTLHDLGTARLRRSFLALFKLLNRLAPDLIVSTFGHINLGLLALRPFLKNNPKVIIREPSTPSLNLISQKYRRTLSLGYRVLYPRAQLVICQSDWIRQEFETDFGLPPTRLVMLCNPIDVSSIRATLSNPQRARGPGLRFVSAGRLDRLKGYDRLVELFAAAPPNAELTILGEGPERPDLERRISRHGLEERVKLPGFADVPWPHVAGADAFLVPSRCEGMPNAALEALACGTPVIATPESGGLVATSDSAPAGAISIASIGQEFLAKMATLEPRNKEQARASLLPAEFSLDRVVERFQSLLLNRVETDSSLPRFR